VPHYCVYTQRYTNHIPAKQPQPNRIAQNPRPDISVAATEKAFVYGDGANTEFPVHRGCSISGLNQGTNIS
jgi:hypothetical protein